MLLSDAFYGVGLVYIEAAPFIYYVENQPAYVDKMTWILKQVDRDEFDVVTCAVTIPEVLSKPIKLADQLLINEYKGILFGTIGLRVVDITVQMGSRAAELRAQYNLRTPDALHLAAALEAGCDAFLTNDVTFKRVNDIKILVLDDLELDPLPPDGAS